MDEGTRVQAEAGWTKRVSRGTTAAPQQSYSPHSVRPDAGSTPAGLECLQADLCRALGGLATRTSTLPDLLLRWPRGQDAQVRGSRPDGVCRISMAAVRCGHPSRGHEWSIVAVLTLCQSLGRYLGQSGKQGPPRGGHLSAYHPDRPRHVAHHLLSKRHSLVECVPAMWRHVFG